MTEVTIVATQFADLQFILSGILNFMALAAGLLVFE